MASILLVDDDRVQSLTRKAILQQTGHEIVVADGAISALQMLREGVLAHGMHLIVTDHLMPKMNGPEFVTEIRRLDATIPILVLSGLPSAESDYEGLSVVFRVKPFPPPELIALARDLIADCLRQSA